MQISQRTFSEAQIAIIMKSILSALKHLHTQQKIHRDIKSGNILVNKNGMCKLGQRVIALTSAVMVR